MTSSFQKQGLFHPEHISLRFYAPPHHSGLCSNCLSCEIPPKHPGKSLQVKLSGTRAGRKQNIQIRCFKACLIKLLLTKVEQDIGKPGQASPLCLKERENGDREICVDGSYVLDLKGHSQSAETPQERAQEINVNFINKYLFPICTPSSTGAPVSKSDTEEARECRNPVM